jgi:hypothetical protein
MKVIYLCFAVLFASFSAFSQKKDKLVPDFIVIQGEGSIGFVSAGIGYNLLESKARFSTHFGIVPEKGGGSFNVISAKLYFKPATFTIWNRVRLNPFDIGIMGSYHYGQKAGETWSEESYPRGYYWWHQDFRLHLGMESSVTYEFKKGHTFHSITGYVEFNTNETYFINFVRHIDTVSVWDIVRVGTGARIYF